MKEQLQLKNHLKEVRTEANLSQAQLAEMVGVSRNTISSIETGQFNPTAKLAYHLMDTPLNCTQSTAYRIKRRRGMEMIRFL